MKMRLVLSVTLLALICGLPAAMASSSELPTPSPDGQECLDVTAAGDRVDAPAPIPSSPESLTSPPGWVVGDEAREILPFTLAEQLDAIAEATARGCQITECYNHDDCFGNSCGPRCRFGICMADR